LKPYYETENGKLYHGDSLKILAGLLENSIDLTVTSPPYDNLRTYNGYSFDFEGIANQLYRVTKPGGVVVWVVGDATVNGSETGTSFKQALYFKDACGFNLHDTMIYQKKGFRFPFPDKYHQIFEYMFVFSKGKLKKFNPISDRKNIHTNRRSPNMKREISGEITYRNAYQQTKYGKRFNVWSYATGKGGTSNDGAEHPAQFPEALARDHIISWSNEGDTVLDCFAGSGTSLKMAEEYNRKWIGSEISEEYCKIIEKRMRLATQQLKLFTG